MKRQGKSESRLLRFPGAPSPRNVVQTDLQPWGVEIGSRKFHVRKRASRLGTIISSAATILVCQTPAPADDIISVNKKHILDGPIATHVNDQIQEVESDLGVRPAFIEQLAEKPIDTEIIDGIETESIPSYGELFHFAVEIEEEEYEA